MTGTDVGSGHASGDPIPQDLRMRGLSGVLGKKAKRVDFFANWSFGVFTRFGSSVKLVRIAQDLPIPPAKLSPKRSSSIDEICESCTQAS